MWCRYGTWHEIRHGAPILQVARNALDCSELPCAPCRHGEHGGVGKVLGIRVEQDTVMWRSG